MIVHLVRHAQAGSRSAWPGPDHERPLNEAGRRQAKALADRLVADGATRILSSPYLRCVETVQPLGDALSTEVEREPLLAEGSPPDPLAARLDGFGDGAVLCSHGDVFGALIGHLAASGAPLDLSIPFEKAGTWILELDGSRVTGARYLPPPTG